MGSKVVLVAHSQRLIAESLKIALKFEPGLAVVDAVPDSGLAALEVALRQRPDIALLDYWLEEPSGPATTRMLLRKLPNCKVHLLCGWLETAEIGREAKDSGASGVIVETAGLRDLVDAVVAHATDPSVRSEEVVPSEGRMVGGRVGEDIYSLTAREIEVLSWLSFGSVNQIAGALSVSPNTVRNHVRKILEKTGARTKMEAVAIASRHGLIYRARKVSATGDAKGPMAKGSAGDPSTEGFIRVLVADSRRLHSDCLAYALSKVEDLIVLEERPDSWPKTLEAISRWMPDVALVDPWMPELDAAAGVWEIRRRTERCRLLAVTALQNLSQIDEMLRGGIAGVFPKSGTLSQLVEGIRQAHTEDGLVFGPELERVIVSMRERYGLAEQVKEKLASLTPRDLQILRLLAVGSLTNEVAKQLNIAPGTVKDHIHRMLKKTGAKSQTDIVAMARYIGLIK